MLYWTEWKKKKEKKEETCTNEEKSGGRRWKTRENRSSLFFGFWNVIYLNKKIAIFSTFSAHAKCSQFGRHQKQHQIDIKWQNYLLTLFFCTQHFWTKYLWHPRKKKHVNGQETTKMNIFCNNVKPQYEFMGEKEMRNKWSNTNFLAQF